MSYIGLLILFSLLLLPGLLGVLFPLLPSIPYMFVIALIFGLIDKFQHLKGNELMILGTIAIISIVVDYLSGILGAKYGGASKKALYYGLIGLIIGIIFLPPFGGVLGLFLGVLIAEIIQHRNQTKAIRAATGSLVGSLVGMGINFLIGILFIILFIIFGLR